MSADRDLAQAAKQHFQRTTVSYPVWRQNVAAGRYAPKDGSATEWGKGFAALDQIDPVPVLSPAYTPFAAASAINKPIPAGAAVHPDSAAMLSTDTFWLLPGSPYREWLGPRDRMLWLRAPFGSLPTQTFTLNYSDAAGEGCGRGGTVNAPMPAGWDSQLVNPDSGDRITWISDPDTGDVWEGYHVTPPGVPEEHGCPPDRWNALRMDFLHAEEKTGLGYGHGFSASGSGILVAAGILTPDDFADVTPGSVIPHALRINWHCGSNGSRYPVFVGPASGGDGQQPGGVPMGARIQLDPTIDVASWPSVVAKPEPWRSGLAKILRTLQVSGAIPVDSTNPAGSGGIESVDHKTPTPFPWDGLGDYQRGVPYDLMTHFRVVDWRHWTGA